MSLSHILNGIYSTEENRMDVINGTLQKGETRRNKRVKNVQTEEAQTYKGKDIQKSFEVTKKDTFKKIPRGESKLMRVTFGALDAIEN